MQLYAILIVQFDDTYLCILDQNDIPELILNSVQHNISAWVRILCLISCRCHAWQVESLLRAEIGGPQSIECSVRVVCLKTLDIVVRERE